MALLLTFSTALLLTIVLIPLTIRYAARWQLVDVPEQDRKIHTEATPRVGGICIVLSVLVSVAYWLGPTRDLWGVFAGSAIIVGFGYLDDRYDLDYKWKFIGQILAILPLLASGVWIEVVPFLGLDAAPLWLSMPLSFFFILGAINAVNLSDGLDGLAAGTMMLSLGVIVLMALQSGQYSEALVGLGVIGGLLGFLRYNTHPASVFMGDAGSQFLGFITAALAIKVTQYDGIAVSPLLPLIILGLPVMDTLLVTMLRMRQGRPLFCADRNHAHHQFIALGFRHYEAVAALYIFQMVLLTTAWSLRYESDLVLLGVYILLCVSVMGAIGWGRYTHWLLHTEQPPIGQERRNLLFRRFNWFFRNASRVIEVLLAGLFISVAYSTEQAAPERAKIAFLLAVAAATLLLLQRYIKLSSSVITRLLVYSAGAVLVYALLIDNSYRPVFNIAIDAYLAITLVTLLLAIRITRKEVFRLDTQDLLILLFILVIPILPLHEVTEIAVGRFTLRFAVLLYCCEYLLSNKRKDYKLLNMATIASMALLASVG